MQSHLDWKCLKTMQQLGIGFSCKWKHIDVSSAAPFWLYLCRTLSSNFPFLFMNKINVLMA